MKEREKYLQICREAGCTGAALLVLIVLWLIAGFGVAQLDVKILHLPLWTITSSIGVWLGAILIAWLLTRYVFKDMPLSENDEEDDINA